MNLAPTAERRAPPVPGPVSDFSSLRGLRGLPDALIRDHLLLCERRARRLDFPRPRLEKERPAPTQEAKDRRRAATAERQLHELYFENISPRPSRVSKSFEHTLSITWGSFKAWQDEFRAFGRSAGVGWVILLMDPVDYQLSNHCVGLHGECVPSGFLAVLVMDVKEHAFAGLERSAYIESFLANIDWTLVEERHGLSRKLPDHEPHAAALNAERTENPMEARANPSLIDALNRMLAKEHACAIRYATHAALITGPHVDPVSKRLQEIAADEIVHAAKLRRRVRALGGMPTMHVDAGAHPPSLTLADILEENIREEREAIEEYGQILKGTSPLDVLLYETLEDILKDEQEHLEELLDLVPQSEARSATEAFPQDFNGRT